MVAKARGGAPPPPSGGRRSQFNLEKSPLTGGQVDRDAETRSWVAMGLDLWGVSRRMGGWVAVVLLITLVAGAIVSAWFIFEFLVGYFEIFEPLSRPIE